MQVYNLYIILNVITKKRLVLASAPYALHGSFLSGAETYCPGAYLEESYATRLDTSMPIQIV